MDRREQVFIGVGLVALAALVLYDVRSRQAAPASDTQAPSPLSNPLAAATAQGPSYLIYNQPWMFSPPIGNFMPQQTNGQIGQSAAATPSLSDCPGCG